MAVIHKDSIPKPNGFLDLSVPLDEDGLPYRLRYSRPIAGVVYFDNTKVTVDHWLAKDTPHADIDPNDVVPRRLFRECHFVQAIADYRQVSTDIAGADIAKIKRDVVLLYWTRITSRDTELRRGPETYARLKGLRQLFGFDGPINPLPALVMACRYLGQDTGSKVLMEYVGMVAFQFWLFANGRFLEYYPTGSFQESKPSSMFMVFKYDMQQDHVIRPKYRELVKQARAKNEELGDEIDFVSCAWNMNFASFCALVLHVVRDYPLVNKTARSDDPDNRETETPYTAAQLEDHVKNIFCQNHEVCLLARRFTMMRIADMVFIFNQMARTARTSPDTQGLAIADVHEQNLRLAPQFNIYVPSIKPVGTQQNAGQATTRIPSVFTHHFFTSTCPILVSENTGKFKDVHKNMLAAISICEQLQFLLPETIHVYLSRSLLSIVSAVAPLSATTRTSSVVPRLVDSSQVVAMDTTPSRSHFNDSAEQRFVPQIKLQLAEQTLGQSNEVKHVRDTSVSEVPKKQSKRRRSSANPRDDTANTITYLSSFSSSSLPALSSSVVASSSLSSSSVVPMVASDSAAPITSPPIVTINKAADAAARQAARSSIAGIVVSTSKKRKSKRHTTAYENHTTSSHAVSDGVNHDTKPLIIHVPVVVDDRIQHLPRGVGLNDAQRKSIRDAYQKYDKDVPSHHLLSRVDVARFNYSFFLNRVNRYASSLCYAPPLSVYLQGNSIALNQQFDKSMSDPLSLRQLTRLRVEFLVKSGTSLRLPAHILTESDVPPTRYRVQFIACFDTAGERDTRLTQMYANPSSSSSSLLIARPYLYPIDLECDAMYNYTPMKHRFFIYRVTNPGDTPLSSISSYFICHLLELRSAVKMHADTINVDSNDFACLVFLGYLGLCCIGVREEDVIATLHAMFQNIFSQSFDESIDQLTLLLRRSPRAFTRGPAVDAASVLSHSSAMQSDSTAHRKYFDIGNEWDGCCSVGWKLVQWVRESVMQREPVIADLCESGAIRFDVKPKIRDAKLLEPRHIAEASDAQIGSVDVSMVSRSSDGGPRRHDSAPQQNKSREIHACLSRCVCANTFDPVTYVQSTIGDVSVTFPEAMWRDTVISNSNANRTRDGQDSPAARTKSLEDFAPCFNWAIRNWILYPYVVSTALKWFTIPSNYNSGSMSCVSWCRLVALTVAQRVDPTRVPQCLSNLSTAFRMITTKVMQSGSTRDQLMRIVDNTSLQPIHRDILSIVNHFTDDCDAIKPLISSVLDAPLRTNNFTSEMMNAKIMLSMHLSIAAVADTDPNNAAVLIKSAVMDAMHIIIRGQSNHANSVVDSHAHGQNDDYLYLRPFSDFNNVVNTIVKEERRPYMSLRYVNILKAFSRTIEGIVIAESIRKCINKGIAQTTHIPYVSELHTHMSKAPVSSSASTQQTTFSASTTTATPQPPSVFTRAVPVPVAISPVSPASSNSPLSHQSSPSPAPIASPSNTPFVSPSSRAKKLDTKGVFIPRSHPLPRRT